MSRRQRELARIDVTRVCTLASNELVACSSVAGVEPYPSCAARVSTGDVYRIGSDVLGPPAAFPSWRSCTDAESNASIEGLKRDCAVDAGSD